MWDFPDRQAERRAEQRAQSWALVVSLAWMILSQVGCVLCWDAGLLTRQASLLYWLVVGVLPPALAMWTMETERARRR
jgi:membrane protein YqaA with SNARE-associated domain